MLLAWSGMFDPVFKTIAICPSILSWPTVPNRCCRWTSGAARRTGRFQTFQVPRRAHQTILDVVTEIQREQDATLVLSLRLPRRHVRLLRHGGERPPALDLPHPRQRGGRRRRQAAARAAAQLHGGEGPRRRHGGVLRQVARRQGPFRARRGAQPISRWCRRRRRSARPPTPASNASAAASAIRPATWWPGTRTISARRRSTAPGRWSTTCATPATTRASMRCPAAPAATPATAT